jgi:hypothetical protein
MHLPAARSHSLKVSLAKSDEVSNALDGGVHTTRNDLRLGFLAHNGRNRTGVSSKSEDLSASTHVPHLMISIEVA